MLLDKAHLRSSYDTLGLIEIVLVNNFICENWKAEKGDQNTMYATHSPSPTPTKKSVLVSIRMYFYTIVQKKYICFLPKNMS